MENTISVTDLCEVTGCKPSTLRAWRNRSGLFPHHAGNEGWTRYDMADGVAVMLMMILHEKGVAGQDAVNLVNQLRGVLVQAASGFPSRLVIGQEEGTGKLEWKELRPTHRAADFFGWFDDAVVLVIDLNKLCFRFFAKYRELKGIPNTPVDVKGL